MTEKEIIEANKIFAENVKLAYTEEYFLAAVNKDTVIALTPKHAKRIKEYLTYEIEMYEKKYGVIDSKWDASIKSPFMGGE